jgi:hypothetical protein
VDETSFIENAIFSKGAVKGASQTGGERLSVKGAGNVTLVEKSDNLVWRMLGGYMDR